MERLELKNRSSIDLPLYECQWHDLPKHLKSWSKLNRMGYRPHHEPVAVIKIKENQNYLYDLKTSILLEPETSTPSELWYWRDGIEKGDYKGDLTTILKVKQKTKGFKPNCPPPLRRTQALYEQVEELSRSTREGELSNDEFILKMKHLLHLDDCASFIYTHPELLKEWNFNKNKTLLPTELTAKSLLQVWWKCEYHHEWQANIVSRLKGRGCPHCHNSKGELKIATFLKRLDIEFLKEYSFQNCRHFKPLPFDFALFHHSKLVGLIEFDGIQHFKVVKGFQDEKGLALQQKRDKIKDNYCQKNNIPLLRIPYWKMKFVEEQTVTFLKEINLL